MKIFNSLENLILEDETVVALGNFDGIHAGHKVILQDAIDVAKEENYKSLCFTFSNHPLNFIMNYREDDSKSLKLICRESDKIKMLENMGFDYLVNVPFDEKIMNMSARDFFDGILIASLNASVVSVGFNYTYGANAEGTAESLYRDGHDACIEVRVHDPVKIYHNIVSSSLIRESLEKGNIEDVSMYLGREYSITGTVTKGNKIGSAIGFPTINIKAPPDILLPLNGVYSSRTIIDGKEYKSITNIGVKPTVGGTDKIVESHIFNYHEDSYGKIVEIVLEYLIREERKFDSIQELKKQIELDFKKVIKE